MALPRKIKSPRTYAPAPTDIERLLAVLNDLPTKDTQKAFLDRYEQASSTLTFGEFNQRFRKDHPHLVDSIGMADRDVAEERLEELSTDRDRLLAIIWAFEKRIKVAQSPQMRQIVARHTTLKMGIPISRIGFDFHGRITLPESEVLKVLIDQKDALNILSRLLVCPIPRCQQIHWIKNPARADTCGQQHCADRLAYIRKKNREQKFLSDEEKEILQRVGPGSKYAKRKEKSKKGR